MQSVAVCGRRIKRASVASVGKCGKCIMTSFLMRHVHNNFNALPKGAINSSTASRSVAPKLLSNWLLQPVTSQRTCPACHTWWLHWATVTCCCRFRLKCLALHLSQLLLIAVPAPNGGNHKLHSMCGRTHAFCRYLVSSRANKISNQRNHYEQQVASCKLQAASCPRHQLLSNSISFQLAAKGLLGVKLIEINGTAQ